MARHKANREFAEFRQLSEWWQGKKRGWKPQFIPEIVAWLYVQAARYKKQSESIPAQCRRSGDTSVAAFLAHQRVAIRVIEDLIREVHDGWSAFDWNDAVEEVSKAYGILDVSKQPVPKAPRRKVRLEQPDHC